MLLEVKMINQKTKVIVNDKKIVSCHLNLNKVKLKVIVNNTETVFNLDISKGKYLGFGKLLESDNVELKQSNSPFQYE